MPWWCAIVFLMAGSMIGVVLMGLCAANNENRNKNGKKWWEDDE